MKRLKFLSMFVIAFCLSIILCGDVKAVNVEFVSEGQPLVNFGYEALVPITGNHLITLESSANASDRFKFYSRVENPAYPQKTINNNYRENGGYNYYILPYGAEGTSDTGRDSYSTRFNGNEVFTVRYHGVASYDGRKVDCLVTICPRNAGEDNYVDFWITDYEGINYTNYGAIGFHDSFYQGFTYFNTGGATISYNLVYEGTNTNIGITSMYWSWGSVNKPEGIASLNNVTNYYLVNSTSYAHTTFTNFADGVGGIVMAQRAFQKNYGGNAGGIVWGVGYDAQHCSDTWGVDDFDRTFVGFKVNSANGIYTFSTLSHDFWFCPFFYPMGATAPKPTKAVKPDSSNVWSDSTQVFVGDKIQYKVDQKVEDRRQGGTGYMKYSSFKYVDNLPKEVEYVSAHVVNQNGVDITNKGTLFYDTNSHTVTFEFSWNFLKNEMWYVGETYSLIIDCIVDSDSIEGQAFTNTPHTIINGTDLYNTPVNVTPWYKSARITVDKVDAETGKVTQGDAKFVNAKYGLYSNSSCTNLLETLVLDENGTKVSGIYHVVEYRNGSYSYLEDFYIKEIEAPEGYLIDNNVYHIHIDRNDILDTNVRLKEVGVTSKDNVIRNDIEITKYLEETDSTLKMKLEGAMFSATLISTMDDEEPEVYYSTITDENGSCKFSDLPYGRYRIQEVQIPDLAYNGEFYVENSTTRTKTFDVYVELDKSTREAYKYNITDFAKKMQIIIYKEDFVTGTTTQGDATLAGAEYTLYRDKDCTDAVETITIRKNETDGTWFAKSGWYLVGTYYVKETKAPEGYLIDENVYTVSQDPKTQTVERTTHTITSKDEVWKGRVQLIKFENILGTTEERPATGAILRLTLDSSVTEENPDGIYYDVTVDEKGYGEFVGDVLKEYYPYTIPYGQYTITEIKESDLGFHTYFYIQPEKVDLRKKHEQLEYRIFGEEPIEAYLKVQKTDKQNGETVELTGAKYKIWDVQNNKWVEQKIYPSWETIDEFETNDEGYFITPQKLLAGDYVVYEIQAPEGYYLNDEYRVPENEADLGDATKGGVAVRIDSVAMGLITGNQLVYDPDAELIYDLEVANDPLKAKLEINKKGEMLSEVLTSETKYGDKYTPKYTMQGLPGVTYEVYAANDIKSPDGRNTYVNAGTKVDTITTNEDGIATTKELFLGEYEIKEIVTPRGYITDENIPNVTLTNTNTLKRVETHKKELTNVRQKLELTFEKEYEEVEYSNGQTLDKKAVFGVYTNQALRNKNGSIVIPQDKLVDVIEVEGENANVTSTIDLPEGEYYVQELETLYPYSVKTDKQYFTLTYTNNVDEFVVVEGEKFTNTAEIVSRVSLIKLSTSTFKNVVINGENVEVTDIDEQVKELINQFKGMTEAEIKEFLDTNNMKYIKDATYKIYIDEDCTKPLYVKSDDKFVEAEMVTDELGMIKLENIPLGKYYIKETKAPKGYELSKEVIELELTIEDRDAIVYKILKEIIPLGELIEKIDIHTKDPVIGCEFEIFDKEGKVSISSITNEYGYAYVPEDVLKNGNTYYFKEISVPEPYTVNPEVFEFVAEFDEENNRLKTTKIEVENTRKSIDFVKVIKKDRKTSEPLQGCVFTIVLLDEDGNEYVNKNGEKVYLVENAVTDENGEYVIENVPYGTYKFVEMVAPEGYKIDEDMTGLTFVASDDTKDGIIFEVTNTGDIQVVALSIVAIISILGVVAIVRKKLVY